MIAAQGARAKPSKREPSFQSGDRPDAIRYRAEKKPITRPGIQSNGYPEIKEPGAFLLRPVDFGKKVKYPPFFGTYQAFSALK